jgi:hypothetical protein
MYRRFSIYQGASPDIIFVRRILMRAQKIGKKRGPLE